MTNFLPDHYRIPDSKSGYFKLKQGANRLRILSPAITGFLYWNNQNKPVRQKDSFDMMPEDIKLKDDGTYSDIKHFWAFCVWNYDLNMVQILEITQSSIQSAMKIKIDNREGNATENDFIITRTGEGFNTEYDVDVANPSPIPTDAVVAMKAKKINLEALYNGGDPFSSNSSPDTQNSGSGFQKFADAANNLAGKPEPVADDIQAMADEMENEVDVDSIPF